MKRSKSKTKSTKKARRDATPPTPETGAVPSRRDLLRIVQAGAAVAIVAGGGGWYLVSEVMASSREHDLSRLGNGIATVVQVHDPGCPRCTALQREVRTALDGFNDGTIQYLIADITRAEGRRFAAVHRVNHVTLLLFDGAGNRHGVLVGPNSAENLEQVFRNHLARHAAS